jgi:tryptophan-rich sensory protein
VAPYVGWIGFANVLTEELWRRNPQARGGPRTLH